MSAKSFTERETAMRKNAEKKRRRRKRKMATLLISFLVVGLTTLVVLSFTVLFKTTEIVTSGNKLYTAEQIIAASKIKTGDNIFLISGGDVSDRLETKLPFITEVKVKRELSGRVTLAVYETKEELAFSGGQKYYSANLDGKLLKEYSARPENLPLLTVSNEAKLIVGEKARLQKTEAELLEKYRQILKNDSFSVDFINISDPYNSYMKIEGRLIIKYGNKTDFELKTAHLEASLKKLDKGVEGVLDLSSWTPKKQEAFFTEQPISDFQK